MSASGGSPAVKALLPALVLLAVAAPAASASPGFSMSLSGPSTPAVVNHPVVVQATIKNPPVDQYHFLTWFDAVVMKPDAYPTCPFDSGNANQIAPATGGAILTIAQRVNVDQDGNYSMPLGFTPFVTGPLLVCGYVYNEVGFTLSQASLTVDVRGAATSAPKPRVKRSGRKLVCKGARGTYGWTVDGSPKRGAHRRTLRITRALRGHRVACTITAAGTTSSSRPIALRR
jgi:hypothetical protein